MAVITVSRQLGSLGDEIARSAADRLGYEHIGKTQISEILLKYGFPESEIDKYDEKKPSLLQTLSVQRDTFAHLIRAVIYELAGKDNVLIVGRGAQVILKDIPGTFHVRVIAPYTTRVGRLMEQMGLGMKQARWIILQSDRDSSGYIHNYFSAKWDDSDLYDMFINTRTMTMNTGVEIIASAVCSDEFKKHQQVVGKLTELALAQIAKAVLLQVTGREGPDLVVQNGAVNLSGVDLTSEEIKECEKAISNIEGITEIKKLTTYCSET